MAERNRIYILGTPVDRVTLKEAAARFVELMERETGACVQIVTPNPEMIWRADKDEEFRRVITEADLVIPDGIGLVHASKVMGEPLAERVAGIDFLSEAARWLSQRGGSAFLLGSSPGVAEKAAESMAAAFPGLRIAGTRHGYFDEGEEAGIIAEINASDADLLCVALGFPKQEMFISRHKSKLAAKVAVGVGGSLDVWAGTAKRAPEFFIKHGLEWFYRLLKEPYRFGRMTVLPRFMIKVIIRKLMNK